MKQFLRRLSRLSRATAHTLQGRGSRWVAIGVVVGSLALVGALFLRAPKQELKFQRAYFGEYDYQAKIASANMTTSLGTDGQGARIAVERQDSRLEVLQPLGPAAQLTSQKGKAVYVGPNQNIELHYTLQPTGLKEDIVLKKKPNEHIFSSSLKLTNLTAQINSAGIPIFTDKQGTYQFHFEKPYAIDAKGERTDSVRYHLIPAKDATNSAEMIKQKEMSGKKKLFGFEDKKYTDQTYVLMTEVDPKWLQDPKRAYPVTIDPTVVHDTTSEFATGQFNNGKDIGSGSSPSLQTYYQELPADEYTVGLWHFDELVDDQCSDGKDVCDSSGNGNNGAQSGGVAINTTTQKVGAAARTFDGTDDFYTVADSNELSFPDENFTVEAWIKRSGNPAAQEYVVLKGVTTWEYGLLVQTAGTVGGVIWTSAGVVVASATSTTTVTDGNWHHVAMVSTGSSFSMYVDGKLDATSNAFSGTAANTAASLYFGDRSDQANAEFQGDIDEIRISNSARSAEEIAAAANRRPYSVFTSDYVDFGTPISTWNNLTFTEYNVQTGDGEIATSSSGLVAAWNLNGTSGTTVTNDAGAGTCGGTASNCDGVLTNVADTSGQDVAALSGWTANDRKWGAGAINFDGSNDYVDIAHTSALDVANNGSFSVEAWIKGTANGRIIFLAQNDGNHGLVYFSIGPTSLTGTANKLVAYLRVDGVGAPITVLSGNTTVNDNYWHHVALTSQYNGSTRDVTFYLDGKVDGTTTMQNGAMTFSAGGTSDILISAASPYAFQGTIDAVRFWSRAISSSDVLGNYQVGGLELQTRVGNDTTPNDGDWEDWKPVTSETQIDSMANVVGWATPSASVWPGAQVATSSSTVIKTEGTQALKVQTGSVTSAANQVAVWHLEETSGSGTYIKDAGSHTVTTQSTGDGADGAVIITASTNINTTAIASGRPTCLSSTACADGIAYRVTAPTDGATSVTRFSGSDTISNGIAAGDEVLLINLQGTSGDSTDVGNYEFMQVQSVTSSTITFTSAITKSYDGTTAANQKVVVQRVPNYTNVTVCGGNTGGGCTAAGTLTASAWEGLTTTPANGAGYLTGIVAFRANGTVQINSGGTITASSLGYRGGSAVSGNSVGNRGETIIPFAQSTSASSNGGGGGFAHNSGVCNPSGGGGGAGGSNGSAAANKTNSCGNPAGGSAIGDSTLSTLYYGGGGGAGGSKSGGVIGGAGGRGGGIIFIATDTLTVTSTGAISAAGGNGSAGGTSDADGDGGGGGGGGTIYLSGNTVTLGSSLVTASAGAGNTSGSHSNGGNGGAGRVYVLAGVSLSGSSSPTATADVPLNGSPTGTTVINGVTGKGRSFNGSSDTIVFSNANPLNFSGGTISISLWVKPGSTQGASARVLSKHGTTSNSGYTFEMNSTPNSNVYYFSWGTGSAFQCTATTITLTPNVWQHIAIVKSGTGLTLYINGVSANTCTGSSATVATSADQLYLGRLASSATGFWNGSMDEVFFSTAAMTADEVQQQYKAGRGQHFAETLSSTDLSSKKNLPFYIAGDRPGQYLQAMVGESALANYEATDSNLRGFWHLEEEQDTGTLLRDATGNGNSLAVSGASYGPAYLNGGRIFDGTNDVISCTDANCGGTSKLDIGTGSWSMGTWVNTTRMSQQMVMAKGTASGQYSYQFQIFSGSPTFQLVNQTNTAYIEASASARVTDGKWHHIAGTYDGTTAKVYIDGVLQKSSTSKSGLQQTDSSSDFQIGGRTDCTTCYFGGALDEPFVAATALTADQIRQMAEVKDRTFPVTINFGASLESTNLITGSSDISFDIDATDYGASNKGDNLYWSDKIIVKENVDGTEYLAQGTVQSVNRTTGAVRINSWDSGSTFPSGGFTADATVFKWERQYWNITKPLDGHINATTRLTFWNTGPNEGHTLYLDDFRSATDYLTTPGGSSITSSTGYRFLQYRMVQSLVDYNNASPALTSITLDYSLKGAPNTPTLDSPADAAVNQTKTPTLRTTATDSDSDYLRYKIQICTNSGMTTGCNTFDQTTSQTGWSGQDAQTSTAYASGTQAVFTVPSNILQYNTTYYWRSYAIDPGGSNTWSGTQTARSFTVIEVPFPPSCTVEKNPSNSSVTIKWSDIYTNESSFTVEKNTDNGGFSSLSTPAANATTATDNSVSNGHTYQYRVRATLGTETTEWCTTTMISLDTGFLNID